MSGPGVSPLKAYTTYGLPAIVRRTNPAVMVIVPPLFARSSAVGTAGATFLAAALAPGLYSAVLGRASSSPGIIGLLIIGTIVRPLGAMLESTVKPVMPVMSA